MLVLTRTKGNRIVIGDDIVVTILSVGRSRCTCEARHDGIRVQVGIDAPRELRVLRGEIYESVRSTNMASLATSDPATLAETLTGLLEAATAVGHPDSGGREDDHLAVGQDHSTSPQPGPAQPEPTHAHAAVS